MMRNTTFPLVTRHKAKPFYSSQIELTDFCELKKTTVPCHTPYFDISHKQRFLNNLEQHLSTDPESFCVDLLQLCRKEIVMLIEMHSKLCDQIVASSDIEQKYDNIYDFIRLVRQLLTLAEFMYIFFGLIIYSNTKVSQETTELMKNMAVSSIAKIIKQMYNIANVAGFFSYCNRDNERIVLFCQTFFSMLETLRFSVTFSDLDWNPKSSELLRLLSSCYLNGYRNSSTFNMTYYRQIVGEYLQATVDSWEDSNISEIVQDAFRFGHFSLRLLIHLDLSSAYLTTLEVKFALQHLEKTVDYLGSLLNCFFDRPDIDQTAISINEKTKKILESPLEPGLPQLNQLKARGRYIFNQFATIQAYLAMTETLFDLSQLSGVATLRKRLKGYEEKWNAIDAEIKQRETVLLQPSPAPAIADQSSKDIKQSKKNKFITQAHYPSEQKILPPFNELPPALPELPPLQEPVPTVRVTVEEQEKDKKLKAEKYTAQLLKNSMFAKPTSSIASNDEKAYPYEFNFDLYAKPIKVGLDEKKLEQAFKNKEKGLYPLVLDACRRLLQRGKCSDHGAAIKFVAYNKNPVIDATAGQKDTGHWFKLKVKGKLSDKVRVFGQVFVDEEGNPKMNFDKPLIGKVHKKQERAAKIGMDIFKQGEPQAPRNRR